MITRKFMGDNVEAVAIIASIARDSLLVNCGGKGGTKGPCPGSGKGKLPKAVPTTKPAPKSPAKAVKAQNPEQSSASVIKKLSKSQVAALKEYSTERSVTLNASMRKCPPKFACVSGKDKKLLTEIESAISKTKQWKVPIEVHRGVDTSGPVGDKLLSAAMKSLGKKGSSYRMPSLTSTSADSTTAKHFSSSGGVKFKIRARRGLHLESISDAPAEKEVLLSSKSRYRVSKVDANSRTIYLDQL